MKKGGWFGEVEETCLEWRRQRWKRRGGVGGASSVKQLLGSRMAE